jgi:FkbM family methyltransferase
VHAKPGRRFPSKSNSLRWLLSHGMTVGTVIDVGVQEQTAELRLLFPDARHILVEPVEEFHQTIRKNYAGLDCELLPIAASDRDGPGSLRLVRLWDDTISHSHVGTGDSNDESRPIEQARLDTVLKDKALPQPFLLKVDVDGHERAVIDGAPETLAKTACLILEAPLAVLTERVRMIEDLGFKLWDIVDLCYLRGAMMQVDLVFISAALAADSAFADSRKFPAGRDDWTQLTEIRRPTAWVRWARRLKRLMG